MPSAIETAPERAQRFPEERTFLTDEVDPMPEGRRRQERVTAVDVRDQSFWAGASDAFANGWSPRR